MSDEERMVQRVQDVALQPLLELIRLRYEDAMGGPDRGRLVNITASEPPCDVPGHAPECACRTL